LFTIPVRVKIRVELNNDFKNWILLFIKKKKRYYVKALNRVNAAMRPDCLELEEVCKL